MLLKMGPVMHFCHQMGSKLRDIKQPQVKSPFKNSRELRSAQGRTLSLLHTDLHSMKKGVLSIFISRPSVSHKKTAHARRSTALCVAALLNNTGAVSVLYGLLFEKKVSFSFVKFLCFLSKLLYISLKHAISKSTTKHTGRQYSSSDEKTALQNFCFTTAKTEAFLVLGHTIKKPCSIAFPVHARAY